MDLVSESRAPGVRVGRRESICVMKCYVQWMDAKEVLMTERVRSKGVGMLSVAEEKPPASLDSFTITTLYDAHQLLEGLTNNRDIEGCQPIRFLAPGKRPHLIQGEHTHYEAEDMVQPLTNIASVLLSRTATMTPPARQTSTCMGDMLQVWLRIVYLTCT